jgi:splicing factor 1
MGLMTSEQRELYVLRVRLQEISHKLVNVTALIPHEEDRSPSPEPVYNAQGLRENSEFRDRLLKERAELLERAMKFFLLHLLEQPQDLCFEPLV